MTVGTIVITPPLSTTKIEQKVGTIIGFKTKFNTKYARVVTTDCREWEIPTSKLVEVKR